MLKYIVLLLITGTVWAQTGLDELVLKNGTEYFGEYLRTEGDVIYLKHKEGFLAYQRSLIFTLKLKDGRLLIDDGIVTKQTTLNSEQFEKLTIEEKADFIEMQAVYDAKKRALKWAVYLILSVTTFGVSMASAIKFTDISWEIPLLWIGSGAISLGGPFYFLKQFKNNTESVNLIEDALYQEIHSREHRKWVLINFTTGLAVASGLSLLFLFGSSDPFLRDFDVCFDPNC